MQIPEGVRRYRRVTSPGSRQGRLDARPIRYPRLIGVVVVLVALLAGMLPSWQNGPALPAQALPATQRANVPVIIEVAPGAKARGVALTLGVVPTLVYSEVFEGFAAELPASAVRTLEGQRGVLRVWPDLPVQAEDQTLPTGVDRIDADQNPSWVTITEADENVDADVAVLDTGIANHSDLNIQGGKACVGSGYTDGNGHGTHVAGTIAAIDNTEGVVGVAPGARLWAVKVLDNSGSGRISSIICGLDWVYKRRATIDVVNLSLSGKAIKADQHRCGRKTTPLHKAICRVVRGGVTVVVAAGNEDTNAAIRIPATYPEVITVSAFTDFEGQIGGLGEPTCENGQDDTFAGFSNFGPDIDIAAPGVCILSTWPGGKYKMLSGTSMATPHVTGAVALYIATDPGPDTPSAARTWLLTDASRPQDSPQGFSGDPDGSKEPALYLGPP